MPTRRLSATARRPACRCCSAPPLTRFRACRFGACLLPCLSASVARRSCCSDLRFPLLRSRTSHGRDAAVPGGRDGAGVGGAGVRGGRHGPSDEALCSLLRRSAQKRQRATRLRSERWPSGARRASTEVAMPRPEWVSDSVGCRSTEEGAEILKGGRRRFGVLHVARGHWPAIGAGTDVSRETCDEARCVAWGRQLPARRRGSLLGAPWGPLIGRGAGPVLGASSSWEGGEISGSVRLSWGVGRSAVVALRWRGL